MGVKNNRGVHQSFNQQLENVCSVFPGLNIIKSMSGSYLRGSLEVVDENDTVIQTFEVEVHNSEGYPSRFPLIYEVNGSIPLAADWHINIGDEGNKKSCCIAVPPVEAIACRNGISIIDFLKDHATPYFYKQAFRLKYGYYPGKEYPHGSDGMWVYYFELFGTKDKERIIGILKMYSKGIHKDSKCFCGKDSRMRRCHHEAYRTLRSMPSGFIQWQLSVLVL